MRSREGERQLVFRRAMVFLRSGWCKGMPAMDKKGNSVNFDSPSACKFCATGALDRAAKDLWEMEAICQPEFHRIDGHDYLVISEECRRVAEGKLPRYQALTDFNDERDRKVEDVLELLEVCAR